MEARRIAFIKPSALGDIVHALPVLTALRARFPTARITWVVNSAYEPLIRNHPDLTDTLGFDRGAFKKGLWHAARYAISFARELRCRRFDLVVDLLEIRRPGHRPLPSGASPAVITESSRVRIQSPFDSVTSAETAVVASAFAASERSSMTR